MAAKLTLSLLASIACLYYTNAANMTSLSLGVHGNATTPSGVPSDEDCTCDCVLPCRPGLVLPVWKPVHNISNGDKAARAIVYFISLAFFFLGVSIISDRFMAAIEVITSKEKEVVIKKPNGEVTVVQVRVWNETVSNLTLMALGSSAPEIMLSVLEVIKNNFEAGDLGPGTIVGSAAFNLFVIMAICVYVIPSTEVRRIKHLRVFFITATWSVFAYLWLYFIIAVITPGEVSVVEALLTFAFFPGTVLTAYVADKRLFPYAFLSKRYRTNRGKTMVVQAEGDAELADGKANHLEDGLAYRGLEAPSAEVLEFEKHRQTFIDILRELRKKNPNLDMRTLEEMAEYEAMSRGPKSRAYYRIQATRKLTGGGNVIKKSKIEKKSHEKDSIEEEASDDHITKIFFEPGHYTVMENIGTFSLTVSRQGGNLGNTVYVDYHTEDGTANAGTDYEQAEGTLVFHPDDTHKQFAITILDDDIFEEDEHFYVRLSNIRIGDEQGMFQSNGTQSVQLANPAMATVMILDDDHAGIFHFDDKEVEVVESEGEIGVKVVRSSGARGRVRIPYQALDGTARGGGKDYELVDRSVVFENDETEKSIAIHIIDDEEYEKNEHFFLELGEPVLLRRGSGRGDNDEGLDTDRIKLTTGDDADGMTDDLRVADMGKPKLGEQTKIKIHIRESKEFKNTVDKILRKANISLVVGTSSWREQFVDALSISAGDDDESEEGEERLPTCMDYVMHFLTLFWKLTFACVPPTDYLGGWACFIVSILMIAILTAFIGDLASSFGCTVGLKDSVTAISFVALGTSVPDTLASKTAAVGDKYADASIGNVTGSNAVNVFLGIGLAWLIASVKHAINGTTFRVKSGSLGFSVTIYCCFALVAIFTLLARRHKAVGGELGGPTKYKIPTSIFLVFLWIMYILLSAFESYCHIEGF